MNAASPASGALLATLQAAIGAQMAALFGSPAAPVAARAQALAPSAADADCVRLLRQAIADAIAGLAGLPVRIGEPYRVRVALGFDTACWTYRPPHEITLGTGIFDKLRPDVQADDTARARCVTAHFWHELGHLLDTERDPAWIERMLREVRMRARWPRLVPFELFNLFEDARIEDRWRAATGRLFGWRSMERARARAQVPWEVLEALIFTEGDCMALLSDVEPDLRDHTGAVLAFVHPFYVRACAADSTLALAPILAEWIEMFGAAGLPPAQDPFARRDLVIFMAGGEGPMADALDAACAAADALDGTAPPAPAPQGSVAMAEAQSADLLRALGEGLPVDAQRVAAVARLLGAGFRPQAAVTLTEEPSRRVHRGRAARGEPARFMHAAPVTPPKVLLLLDCSGSMEESMIEGRVLVAALSTLARAQRVAGHVVLSITTNEGVSHWQRFALPMPLDAIERIPTNGAGEGFANTIAAHMHLARATGGRIDVYTDGEIRDRPVDRPALGAAGISLRGLYCGDSEATGNLAQHFDRVIVRADAAALAAAIARH